MIKHPNILISSIILIVCFLFIGRYSALNSAYPDPPVISAGIGEDLEIGDFVFSINNWEWHNGDVVHELIPDYIARYDSDGSSYSSEKIRIILVEVFIMNNSDEDMTVDLSSFAFESGAWHNQWDCVLFEELNKDNPSLYVDIEHKQKVAITFPITMYDDQFTSKDWRNIENRAFSIVLTTYPYKYVLMGV